MTWIWVIVTNLITNSINFLIVLSWRRAKLAAVRHWPRVEFLSGQSPAQRQGLIIAVSRNQIATAKEAIRWHRPSLRHCWLLCSAEAAENAAALRSEFDGERVVCHPPVVITDVNDPMQFYRAVQDIYARLPEGLKEEDVIADYTGMTAHASVGIALACSGKGRPIQYVPARIVLDELTPLPPIEIKIDWPAVAARKKAV